jgi:hypothetical protein
LSFLKAKGLLVELVPLNSKARYQNEGGKLLTQALKHWFVPTDLVREYYGESVAMYYSWMNFLIKWLTVPGGLSIVLSIVNSYFYTVYDSPLNSIYSIIVAVWATLFVIFWKRRCRGLFIEWDNHNSIY